MKRVSIKDVAKAARVSHPTVSRALRNSPLVKAETSERIRRLAETMGYRPNVVARGLVTCKTWTIAAVVTTLADPFNGELLSGLEELATDRGYSVFVANCNADPDREIKAVRLFQERRVDGIVVMCSRVGVLYGPMLRELRIPIILVNSYYPNEFFNSIVINNPDASRQAVQHLIDLGHRRIAYIGDQYGLQSDTERFAGYREALELAGLPLSPELVVNGNGKADGGQQATERLLALPTPPTALFCYNDQTALGALSAIRHHGLRVPDDISVVGFDDLEVASYAHPPLTTVRQPRKLMGRMAMEMLLNLFSSRSTDQSHLKIPGELIVRESTAPLTAAPKSLKNTKRG